MAGPGSPYTELDSKQVLTQSFDETQDALRVLGVSGSLVPDIYDSIALTYVASGNGQGEIETVTYANGGSTIALLTLSYDADNRLILVERS